MEIRSQILACLLPTMMAFAIQAQPTPGDAVEEVTVEVIEEAPAPVIEEQALAVLKGMADTLDAAPQFDYEIETTFDVVQQSGTKIEFGASRKIQVSRPDLMRMEVQRRDGTLANVVFDGKKLWVYIPEQKVYAKAEQHGDLVEAIDYAVSELGMEAPLQSLVSPNFYESALANLTRALLLEESVVMGVACEHLLLSNDYTDFQLWITKEDKPVLRRIVITYREAPGEPQFTAQFLKWDLSPEHEPGQFTFAPPKDAREIRFAVSAPATDLDQEDRK